AGTSRRYEGSYKAEYRGRPAPNPAESVSLVDAVQRRRQEFEDFLALGRSLVVIACPSMVMWVDSGKRETSGTGRNQKVTTIVKDIDLLDAVPFDIKTTAGTGLELRNVSPQSESLWRQTREGWAYRCYLDKYPGDKLLEVAGTRKVVGSLHFTGNGGMFALLPEPYVGPETPESEDDDGAEVETQPVDSTAAAMVEWAFGLSLADADVPPDWTAQFKFPTELSREQELAKVERSISRLLEKVEGLKRDQAEDDAWKRLAYATGAALEEQARRAFEVLGFSVLEAERGRSDLRLEHSGTRVVVEVKGLSKSAAEKNAAQLEKWVAEELAEGESAKGILVANTWRESSPDQREIDYPDQMLPYASARGHCLVTGLQLLALARAVAAGDMEADAAALSLISTTGRFAGSEEALTREAPTSRP
ncbi:hypothetical protein, partial [Microbacterium sp.]|uniref:hypothetical protein n=1 Tax=Microbacterium sp. TaxID=51671 RepID=UPI002735DE02